MRLFIGVTLLVLFVTCHCQNMLQQTCSVSGSWATIQNDADAIVGGLICSQPYVELQSYEAVRWAFDVLNKEKQILNGQYLNHSYVPGVKLGMRVNNVCNTNEAAISGATEFFPQLSSVSSACNKTNNLILGVIGTSNSGTSMVVAKYLEKFNIPIISYEATAPSLSDSTTYPSFMRTIPPDGPLMAVIIEVLNKLNWKYLVVIFEDSVFGRASHEAFLPKLTAAGICLTTAIRHSSTDSVTSTLERAIISGTTGVIFFGGQKLASDLLNQAEVQANAGKLQWIFTDSLPFSKEYGTKIYQRGVLSIVATSRFIVEIEDHWVRIDENNPSPENPWFKQWYMEQNKCRLNGFNEPHSRPVCIIKTERQKRKSFNQNPFVEPAVHAVFTYAYALRQAHRDRCGVDSVGMCPGLRDMKQSMFFNEYLKKVDFIYSKQERVPSLASDQYAPYFAAKRVKFNENGDIIDPSYDVWNFNDVEIGGSSGETFRRVGTYINGRLDMNLDNVRMYSEDRKTSLPSIPSSLCTKTSCGPCLGVPPEANYLFIKGDVVLTGMFSLHKKGVSPLSCGDFDGSQMQSGIQFLHGMLYGILTVLQLPILNGVRLGGLAFDDCQSELLGTTILTQVQQGSLVIKDDGGELLDPRTIDGYTAAHTNTLTFPIAELMNTFKRPLLAYSSTDDDLLDYSYYLRSTYGSQFEKRAIIKMLKRLGFHYVQLVYENYESFKKGNTDFRKIAAEEGICVVATILADADGSETVEMLRKQKHTRAVVLNVGVMGNRKILQGIKDQNATGEFALFGLQTFGKYESVVKGNEDAADGVISLGLKHSTLVQYETYLKGLRVESQKVLSPWFEEWYQHIHGCYLGSSNPKGYAAECKNIDTTAITDGNFTLMYNTDAIINAVYAFAYGLDATMKVYCGDSYNGVCDNFRNSHDKGQVLLDKIKAVSFTPKNSPYIVRFNNKEVDQPFVYYNYVNGKFVEMGEYEGLNDRIIIKTAPQLYKNRPISDYNTAMCPGRCVECFYMFQAQDYMYIDGDLIIPGIFDVHYSETDTSPFGCGNLRIENGFQYVEAFAFALNYINDGKAGVGLNNNLRLGGLAFDGCSNALRATTITNAFQSSAISFKDNNGKYIDNRKTLAWLGYDSQSTINMADILGSINIPIVSPGATSPTLNNKDRFKTFFRTIPSESVVAKGMADLSKSLGFEFVVTLNAPDTASREARDLYRENLKKYGICVLASYEFSTDGSMDIILDSLNQTTTRAVAIFAEPDMYVADMMKLNKEKFFNSKFVFISNRKFNSRVRNLGSGLEKSISFDLNAPKVQQFIDYLQKRSPSSDNPNPWFREYFEKKFDCQLTGLLSGPAVCPNRNQPIVDVTFEQDLYVLSTINAVYALTEGVHQTLKEKCGSTYTTICSKYLTDGDTNTRIMNNMERLNITDIVGELFYFIQREGNQGYKVNQYFDTGTQREVAVFKNSILTYVDEGALRDDYRDVISRCVDNCEVCSDSANNYGDFTHIAGDIYLIGLFDVHKKGATPFSCGEINDKHGFQLLEAFNYAVDYVNNKSGIFRGKLEGVYIGGIGLDVCQNPTRAANLVTNIHSKNINLIDPINKIVIQPKRFDVYVGPLDTDSSIRVADVLDSLSITQITYGATSLELQDKKKYRYFLRSVPADDKQARAIISYLKRFENNFVQIISTFDSVGLKGKEEFVRLAPLNKICVEKEIVVGYNGPVTIDEANDALNQLLSNMSAKVVVLFVDDPRVILQAAEQRNEIRQNFFFIGTDKWGMDDDMLVGLDRLIENRKAVTFDIETADVPGFDHYLQYKTPNNYFRNPWFKDFYERQFQCNKDAASTKYSKQCTKSMMGISRNPNYVQDPYVLYVVNAVFSAALGIHHSLQELCPDKNDPTRYYNGVCSLFRNSGERRQRIYRGIKQVEFTDDTYQPFYYLESGESDRGYHIYEPRIEQSTKRYFYDNVGSYNDTHYLKIDITYDMNFQSRCTEGVDCPCTFPKYEPTRYMLKESKFNLNLVYVADVHKPSPNSPYECGSLASMSNLQSVLAFFFAIEQVNGNQRLPASLKLGGLAIDTCSQPMRIGEDVYSLLSGEGICHSSGKGQIISPASIVSFHALTTSTSVPLSRILTPYKIVSLSPGATSVSLSDKRLHPFFLRTVPPDNIQVLVMLQVMKQFNWDYASIIYTNSDYGISARNLLIQQAAIADLKTCFGIGYAMSSVTTLSQAEEILVSLSQKVGARVVILFTEPEHSRLLLQAAKSKGLTGRFVWLASDYWANSMEIIAGYEEEAAGAITIQIRSEFVQSFNTFMMDLTFTNRRGIPDDWFDELYQTLHKCRLLNSQVTKEFPQVCSGNERITANMITQDPFVLHTIIAVFQIAEGLNNIGACRSSPLDVYACLSLQQNRRELIYNSIHKTQFTVLPDQLKDNGFTFKFTSDGYGDIGYNILNFNRDVTQDRYIYTKIGTYQESLKVDRSLYRGLSMLSAGVIPISTCPPSVKCNCFGAGAFIGAGGAVITKVSDGGLLIVPANKLYSYVHINGTASFIKGDDGNYLDSNTGALLVVYGERGGSDRFFDIWGIIIAAIAAIGALIALCMFIYLLIVYPVRSGTTILGFLLLFGIILMYLLVFAFIFHASPVVCAFRRFALGLVYALVYAVLFVKLVDCWRSRNATDEVRYSKIGRPLGLFFLVILLVLVQVIIVAEWLILVAPGVTSIYYNFFIWPLCAPVGYYDTGLILSLVYVMFLIILCVIFGFACFSSTRNHYESRWILGIAILSIPTWVIWCLVAVLADYKFRDAAVAVGLLLNATYMLLCGPLRKMYLLNKYQALIDEEERELQKEKKSYRGTGSVSSYNQYQYDNTGQLFHGHGSVHGSRHGSRHGTMQSSHHGYNSSRGGGQMMLVQSSSGGHGGRLYSQGSSNHGYQSFQDQGGHSTFTGGMHTQGGAMIIQEDIHPTGVSDMVTHGESSMIAHGNSEMVADGNSRMVAHGDSGMVAGAGGVAETNGMAMSSSDGHYSEVHHGDRGGVSVSEAFGSRTDED